jgi:hypothetical protein
MKPIVAILSALIASAVARSVGCENISRTESHPSTARCQKRSRDFRLRRLIDTGLMKPAKYIVIGCVKPSFMIRGIKEGSTQR